MDGRLTVFEQFLLALKLSLSAKITSVEPEQIEGIKLQSVLASGGQFGLQLGNVSPALPDDDNLTVGWLGPEYRERGQ